MTMLPPRQCIRPEHNVNDKGKVHRISMHTAQYQLARCFMNSTSKSLELRNPLLPQITWILLVCGLQFALTTSTAKFYESNHERVFSTASGWEDCKPTELAYIVLTELVVGL